MDAAQRKTTEDQLDGLASGIAERMQEGVYRRAKSEVAFISGDHGKTILSGDRADHGIALVIALVGNAPSGQGWTHPETSSNARAMSVWDER